MAPGAQGPVLSLTARVEPPLAERNAHEAEEAPVDKAPEAAGALVVRLADVCPVAQRLSGESGAAVRRSETSQLLTRGAHACAGISLESFEPAAAVGPAILCSLELPGSKTRCGGE